MAAADRRPSADSEDGGAAPERTATWKKLALVFVSLGLSFAAAEGIYRYATAPDPDAPDGFDYEWRERYIQMNETIYRRSEDPHLVYEPTPSSAVEMEYGTAGFNAQSMREAHDVALEPGPDRRVAIVGDSLVWSEFLPVHEALPQRIDEALGDGFEVLNFGVSGYDTGDEVAWYRRGVAPYRPAVVVVVYCMNDMMIMSGPFERFANDAERALKTAQETMLEQTAPVRRETIDDVVARAEQEATFKLWARFTGILERRRFDANYDDEYLAIARQPAPVARFQASMDALHTAIAQSGAKPLFVISPVLESWDDYHWDALHTLVGDAARTAGFQVLDPLDEWRGAGHTPEEMRVSGDNLHYDQSGNRVFAASVADFVRSAE